MAAWIDVTAPANWSAVAAVFGELFDYGDCTTSIPDPALVTTSSGIDSGGGTDHVRLAVSASGNLYVWSGTEWAAGDDSPAGSAGHLSDFPFLRYIGALTGIEKWRITAKTVQEISGSYPPPGIATTAGATECPSLPGFAVEIAGLTIGTIPAGTTYVMESINDVGQCIMAVQFGNVSDVREIAIANIMEITKIEAYAEVVGDFWADFTGAQEFDTGLTKDANQTFIPPVPFIPAQAASVRCPRPVEVPENIGAGEDGPVPPYVCWRSCELDGPP